MNAKKRLTLRMTVSLAAIFAVCLATTMSGEPRQHPRGRSDSEQEKLEPVLQARARQVTNGSGTMRVIVQFDEPEAAPAAQGAMAAEAGDMETPEFDAERAMARAQVIYGAGGRPSGTFNSSIPIQAAEVDRDALDRPSRDSRVRRISLDYPVKADLYRSARAVGADQV